MDKSKLLRWLERKIVELENEPKKDHEDKLIFGGGILACKIIHELIVKGEFD
jgi:hypothetical protein